MKKFLWIILIAAIFAIIYFIYGKEHIMGDCCPHATLYLQPYDNFTQNEVEKLKADLDNHLGEIIYGVFEVFILGRDEKEISD